MKRKIKGLALSLLAVCVAAAGAAGYALFIEPNLLTAVNYKLSSDKAGRAVRLVFFSDTHFGLHTDSKKAEKTAELINAQKPDIVVFGGDFFDNYSRDREILDLEYLKACLTDIDAEIKLAVFGNHDYGGGAVNAYREIMTSAGFKVLFNESEALNELGVEIIGVDDAYNRSFRTADLAPKTALLPVYICHQPDVADELLFEGAVMLSGHTHGGQILLPFVTQQALPPFGRKYRKGEFTVNNGKLFVSSGLGTTSVAARFLNVPEIVVLDISAKEEGKA